jgi:hypothetical protein
LEPDFLDRRASFPQRSTIRGLVDREFFLEIYSGNIIGSWEALSDTTAILRERFGQGIWENFEYAPSLPRIGWHSIRPVRTPANVRRLDVPNKWREADQQYAASLAPA